MFFYEIYFVVHSTINNHISCNLFYVTKNDRNMRRVCFILALCCFYPCVSFSQVIRVNNGISISSLNNSNKIEILNDVLTRYTLSVGIDFVENRYWNLSGEVCYVEMGGIEKDLILVDGTLDDLSSPTFKEKNKHVQFNTTFRIKTSKKYQSAYIGVGPSVSLSVGDEKFKSLLFSDYTINKFLFGIKSEVGINRNLSGKLYGGINGSYTYYFNNFAFSDFDQIKSSLFTITLMIGYDL